MRRLPKAGFLTLLLFAAVFAGALQEVDERLTSEQANILDAQMDLSVGVYRILACEPSEGLVAEVRGSYDDRKFDYELEFDEHGERCELYFGSETRRKRISDIDDADNEWEFRISPDVELFLNLDIGAAETIFDFAELSVAELELDVGAADAQISFATPNKTVLESFVVNAGACDLDLRDLGNAKFRDLEFDGGVGSFLLDFRGEFDYHARADISVGLGSIDIILPDDIGVRLEVDDNWFSSVDFPRRRFDRVRSGVYETENYDDADGKLELTLDIGMGSADIEFR